MASVHRRPGSKVWRAAFTGPDGKKWFRTTGSRNRAKALRIAIKLEDAARLGRERRLTEAAARRTIAEIFRIANADSLPTTTVHAYLDQWMQAKSLEVADSSAVEYRRVVADFVDGLGKRADLPLDAIGAKDVLAWRARMAERVSPGTVNRNLKILQGAWTAANRAGLVDSNIVRAVETMKADRTRTERRAFTLDELRRILAVCSSEWRGMVLFGLYTGQRLRDIAELSWNQIDTATGVAHFITRKTAARITVPLARPVAEWIATTPAPDQPDAPLFPELVALDQATLSAHFRNILEAAGIVRKKTKEEAAHAATGKGRSARRETSEVSFHALRHTAASLLHDSGAGQAVAQAILGHQSEAVHRRYVHVETDQKRRAVDALPDVTKAGPKS
jgi:integrase